MKKLKYLSLLSLLLTFSCYEDKGNYEPYGITEIEVTGIEESYNVMALDVLDINAEIKDPELYNFTWTVYAEGAALGTVDTIQVSDTPALNYVVGLSQNIYNLNLIVENKENLDTKFFTAKLSVETEYSRGLYILKGIENNTLTDMDFVNSAGEVKSGLLSNITGHALNGAPKKLSYTPSYKLDDIAPNGEVMFLFPISEAEVNMIRIDDMSCYRDYESMFYLDSPQGNPRTITYGGAMGYVNYLSDTGLYSFSNSNMASLNKFAITPLAIDYTYVDFSPAAMVNSYMYDIIYDELNCRFLYGYYGALTSFAGDIVNNLNCDLLYMGEYQNSESGIAVLKERETGQIYLFDLAYDSTTMMYAMYMGSMGYSIVTNYNEVSAESGLNNATYISHYIDSPLLYYTTEGSNSVCMYNVTTNTDMGSVLDLPAGEEVTMIQHEYWLCTYDATEYQFNNVAVATYKDGNYKLYMYNVIAGQPDGEPVAVYEGEGRVQDLVYVSPIFYTYSMNLNTDCPPLL